MVEPLAAVDVNVPGVMAMVVAPEAAQLRVLLAPWVMLAGDAAKELMAGRLAGVTVTSAVAVLEPAALVTLRV